MSAAGAKATGTGAAWRDAAIVALVAAVLLLPMMGLRTVDSAAGLTLEPHFLEVLCAVGLVFIGRLLSNLTPRLPLLVALAAGVCGIALIVIPLPSVLLRFVGCASCGLIAVSALKQRFFPKGLQLQLPAWLTGTRAGKGADRCLLLMIALAALLPWLPFADRYVLDVLIMVLTYAALAYGLNIVVGYTGLLDLGYVAYYAIGAYCCALLAQKAGFSFWLTLPFAGGLAALVAGMIGGPILRLRGDYLAIVTLGFAEITRLVLINAVDITGGPNGISGVPRPSLFGLDFIAHGKNGAQSFNEFFGLAFSPVQRLVFLYYLMFLLALAIGWLGWALRRLPLGRAWEAQREDEIACAAMGINRARIRLAAYMLGALCAGLCGAFFAARQGFISPESFSFAETSTVLAIVVLGGIGHPLGILLAALFVIGLPELFRELEQYRMIAFGAGMVLIMIWRPGGLMANRLPAVLLEKKV
jgi:branched-chain amino acid transport system permease protein